MKEHTRYNSVHAKDKSGQRHARTHRSKRWLPLVGVTTGEEHRESLRQSKCSLP